MTIRINMSARPGKFGNLGKYFKLRGKPSLNPVAASFKSSISLKAVKKAAADEKKWSGGIRKHRVIKVKEQEHDD